MWAGKSKRPLPPSLETHTALRTGTSWMKEGERMGEQVNEVCTFFFHQHCGMMDGKKREWARIMFLLRLDDASLSFQTPLGRDIV